MSESSSNAESAFTFIPRGAAIQEFKVAGHNIVQNFPEAALYASVPHPYFGETIGRTTNRIKGAAIHNLNGKSHDLNANSGEHNLHGGLLGWGRREWEGPSKVVRGGKEGVFFRYVSQDGEEGFPGTVEARVWYVAEKEKGKTVLIVEYEVELVGDECEETVVGVTNHRYNMNSIENHTFPQFHTNSHLFVSFPERTYANLYVQQATSTSISQLPPSKGQFAPSAQPHISKFILMAFLQVRSKPSRTSPRPSIHHSRLARHSPTPMTASSSIPTPALFRWTPARFRYICLQHCITQTLVSTLKLRARSRLFNFTVDASSMCQSARRATGER